MLRIFHISTLYRRISPYNVQCCIVGALRRRCFPIGETTGKILSSPTNAKMLTAHKIRTMYDAVHPCRGRYHPPGDSHRESRGTTCRNVPCFDIIAPNFTAKCSMYIVGAMRRRCFPAGETTGRLIAAPTWRMPPNFCSVILWHRPCRGG